VSQRNGLRSRPKRSTRIERTLARDFRAAVLRGSPCLGCGARADDPHHVVYQQHLRQRHLPLWDPRDGIALCRRCHEAHHNRSQPIACSVLPDAALEFAFEHLGAYAADYLSQRYANVGKDGRVAILLERAWEGAA
jgi:hypothetical protein